MTQNSQNCEKRKVRRGKGADWGRSDGGIRGMEVRARTGCHRIISTSKPCSIDDSRRDASIEHGFMVDTNQELLEMSTIAKDEESKRADLGWSIERGFMLDTNQE